MVLRSHGPVIVEGDDARLRQVIANLLANTRDHTPAATAVKVAVSSTDDEAVVDVTDDGPGLSDDEAAKVFDRFWRADFGPWAPARIGGRQRSRPRHRAGHRDRPRRPSAGRQHARPRRPVHDPAPAPADVREILRIACCPTVVREFSCDSQVGLVLSHLNWDKKWC